MAWLRVGLRWLIRRTPAGEFARTSESMTCTRGEFVKLHTEYEHKSSYDRVGEVALAVEPHAIQLDRGQTVETVLWRLRRNGVVTKVTHPKTSPLSVYLQRGDLLTASVYMTTRSGDSTGIGMYFRGNDTTTCQNALLGGFNVEASQQTQLDLDRTTRNPADVSADEGGVGQHRAEINPLAASST